MGNSHKKITGGEWRAEREMRLRGTRLGEAKTSRGSQESIRQNLQRFSAKLAGQYRMLSSSFYIFLWGIYIAARYSIQIVSSNFIYISKMSSNRRLGPQPQEPFVHKIRDLDA